jgi:hypothetical protein
MMPQLEAGLASSDGASGGMGADTTASPQGLPRYKGVTWNAASKKWDVQWWNPATRKKQHSGCFAVGHEETAALRYDALVREHGGTVVNFPDELAGETQARAGEPPQPRGASNFRGVTATAKGNRFQAKIKVAGSSMYLGAFATAEDAARAYDCRARELGRLAARLNFPHETNLQAPMPLPAPHHRPVGASRFRGVSLTHGKFDAAIWAEGRMQHLGAFETAEEAARAYDAAARKLGKPADTLNFPNDAAHDTPTAGADVMAVAAEAAAQQQPRKRMRTTAADADDAAVMAQRRTQLAARVAALERALSDTEGAEAGSAARATTLAAQLVASQAHVAELQARADALHAANAVKRERAEVAEAATAAAARTLEHETGCCMCLAARRDTLFFTCGHALCAGCGAQLAQCPMCAQPPRSEPLRVF